MGMLERLFGEEPRPTKPDDTRLQAMQMMERMQLTGFQLEMDGHQTAAAMKQLLELDRIRQTHSDLNPELSALLLRLELAYTNVAVTEIQRGRR